VEQVAVFEWIKKNIAAFGGYPVRMTIMGQSAEAMSVHYLTVSSLAKGLFIRAIAQSSFYARLGPEKNLASAEQTGERYMAGFQRTSFGIG
jgi:para-nitrobenzyl esterase